MKSHFILISTCNCKMPNGKVKRSAELKIFNKFYFPLDCLLFNVALDLNINRNVN